MGKKNLSVKIDEERLHIGRAQINALKWRTARNHSYSQNMSPVLIKA